MTGKTLVCVACAICFVAFVLFGYMLWLPDVSSLKSSNPMTTKYVQIYTKRILRDGDRPAILMHWVPLNKISPYLRFGVLIAEDDRFYQHRGIDWQALKSAISYNFRKRSMARGASTITQQVARNLFLSPSRRIGRKVAEVLIARHLERTLGKDRILEIYLNIVEWGEGVFGAEAASQVYFGKSAAGLTKEEAVQMAAALPSPYRMNPQKPANALMIKKRDLYMKRLLNSGYLTGNVVSSNVQE